MKKALRITGIVFGSILLLLILLPMVFKSRIESTVKEKINEQIYATVDWSRFSLSLLRGFPDLSINLHGLSVVGEGDFQGDTLLGLERFEFRANPFSAIRKDIEVSRILLHRPLISARVLEDGRANWDITAPAEEEELTEEAEDAGGGSSMRVSLEEFAIRQGRVYYEDRSTDLEASMEAFDFSLSGDLSLQETVLELAIAIGKINASMGGVRYMQDGQFGLDLLASANLVEQRYSMLENEIRLNGLVLGVEGDVLMKEDGAMDMDLDFFSRETSFKTLLSLVPAIYLQDFDALETSGSLELHAAIKGQMKDSILPDARVELSVKDGYFSYPDLPKDVSDVQIHVLADYNGSDVDKSVVSIERFHLLLGGNPFEIGLNVSNPISDMHVAGAVKGMIDFTTLKDVVPLEDLEIGGRLNADLSIDTRMSYIENERYEDVDLDGRLVLEGINVESGSIPVPVQLKMLELNFTPRFVELAGLDLSMGQSDLYVQGRLENFIPYVFDDQTVSGSLSVQSGLVDANELMPATTESDSTGTADTTQEQLEEGQPDETAAAMKIPENLDFTLNLDLKEVRYEEIVVENISGQMRLREGVAYLDGLSLGVIDGEVKAAGLVDTRLEPAQADLELDIAGMDIPLAYETFMTVERLAPMAKYCKGKANVSLDYRSSLDAGFSPLLESIDASGRIFTKDVQFYNLRSFVSLSELLNNDKFRNAAPDNMDIKFRVVDGKVIVDPFEMKVERSAMEISGAHGIDMSLDYLLDMDIATADLGEGANQLMAGMNALAAGIGLNLPDREYIKVKARITGTFDDPKISTDLSGNMQSGQETVKAAVEEKVKEEVKKVEEDLREDAREQADEILKEAEEQAEAIMLKAQEAGDDLVKEAEIQGEKLVEEAKKPWEKIAAREAAKELVRQAEKQRENLLKEAREQSDKILEEARQKAEKI